MRLLLLTTLCMTAFAANSVLNRLAVGGGVADPLGFVLLRLISGALMLSALVWVRHSRQGLPVFAGWQGRQAGVVGLLVYLFGFSLAYRGLDAGTGALILFGTVQVTMFAGALSAREPISPRRWLGAALALAGLAVLLSPSGLPRDLVAAGMMVLAGIGWGVYSLAGRRATDALGATAANFVLSVPIALVIVGLLPGGWAAIDLAPRGIVLAIFSGAVTSGMGYALWYRLVPQLGAVRAAVAQLTAPFIAAAGGLALMSEATGLRFFVAAALVMAGVLLTVTPARRPA